MEKGVAKLGRVHQGNVRQVTGEYRSLQMALKGTGWGAAEAGRLHEQQGRCWTNFSVSYVAMQEEFCSPWGPIGWSRIAMSDLGRWGHACGSGSAI